MKDIWISNTLSLSKAYSDRFPLIKIWDILIRSKLTEKIEDDIEYNRVTIKLYGKWVSIRDTVMGKVIGTKNQWTIKEGQFIISKIDARNGAFWVVPHECDGAIATNDFPSFDVDHARITPEFLNLITTTKEFQNICELASTGTTGRRRVDMKKFLDMSIPLPDIDTQKRIVSAYYAKIDEANRLDTLVIEKEKEIENYLMNTLGITIENTKKKVGLNFVRFKNIQKWWTDFILENHWQRKSNFEYKRLDDFCTIIMGASPDSKSLNEKGNGYPFIWGAVEMNEEKQVFEISRYCDKPTKINELWDIIFCVRATIWKPIVADKQYCLGRGVWAIRLETDRVLFEYLFLILKQAVPELIEKWTWSTFKQITKQVLASHKVSIPPKEVQTIIVKYIKAIKTEILEMKNESKKLRIDAKNFFEKELFS